MIAAHRRVQRAIRIGFLAGGVIAWSQAQAQAAVLKEGDRVRFTLAGGTIEHAGRVGELKQDSLILRSCEDCQQKRYAMADFAALSVYRHVSTHRVRNGISGSLIGLFVGGLALGGYGAYADRNCHDGPCGVGTAIGAFYGGVIGAGVGAVIGSGHQSGEWQSVLPDPDSVALVLVAAHMLADARTGGDVYVWEWPSRRSVPAADNFPPLLQPTDIERRRIRILASALHATITNAVPTPTDNLLYVLGPIETEGGTTTVTVHQYSRYAYDIFGYKVRSVKAAPVVERKLYYAQDYSH